MIVTGTIFCNAMEEWNESVCLETVEITEKSYIFIRLSGTEFSAHANSRGSPWRVACEELTV